MQLLTGITQSCGLRSRTVQRRDNNQNCPVLCCVRHLCRMVCIQMRAVLKFCVVRGRCISAVKSRGKCQRIRECHSAWRVVTQCVCRVCCAALQPVTKLQAGTSPVIFKQQQVVVQQMAPQSYIKSNAQSIAGGTHIQHIITSLPVTAPASSAVSAASVLNTQIVGATTTPVTVAQPQVTFTKTLSLTITTTTIATSMSCASCTV